LQGESNIQYHHISNFELGIFGNQHAVNVFFPKLRHLEHAHLFLTTKRERELWYDHGFRKVIEALGTTHLALEYPATIEAEHARDKKRSG